MIAQSSTEKDTVIRLGEQRMKVVLDSLVLKTVSGQSQIKSYFLPFVRRRVFSELNYLFVSVCDRFVETVRCVHGSDQCRDRFTTEKAFIQNEFFESFGSKIDLRHIAKVELQSQRSSLIVYQGERSIVGYLHRSKMLFLHRKSLVDY